MSESVPMTTSLAGKVALVTGGGVRVGRAIALALAQRGANIAFTHLACEECAPTADEIAALGVEAMALTLDVREPGAPARVGRAGDRALRPARHPGEQRVGLAARAVPRDHAGSLADWRWTST